METITFILPDNTKFNLDAEEDGYGVLRFKRNTLIDVAFDESVFSLNDLAHCYRKNPNKIKLEDVIRFWAMLGYSVDGLCDLSFLSEVIVITPQWTKGRDSEYAEDE